MFKFTINKNHEVEIDSETREALLHANFWGSGEGDFEAPSALDLEDLENILLQYPVVQVDDAEPYTVYNAFQDALQNDEVVGDCRAYTAEEWAEYEESEA